MLLILKKRFFIDLSLRNILSILCSLFFVTEVLSAPATVTFQARIVRPDLTNLESSNVSFKFYYLYPKPVGTDLQCVIYAEEINGVNMTGSKGLVTLQLGSGTRTYGSGNLKNVFDNSTVSYACQAGGTYVPAANDNRRVIVQFNDGTGLQTLPPSDLSAVPYSMQSYNSQRLGNVLAADFLKFTDFTGTCGVGEYLKYDSTASPKFSCAIPTGTGAGIVMSVAPGTGPLLVGGTATDPTISIPQASASTDGYLSSADFTTFSSKLSNLSSLTSGDITGKLGFTPAANNDSRFTDTRTPTDGSVTAAKIASATITFDKFNQSSAISGQVIKWNGSAWVASTDNTSAGGTVTSVAGRTGVVTLSSGDISGLAFGTTAGTFAQGNDSRFADQRTPTDNSVTSAKILDGTIAAADLSSMDASVGQVMKWNGSAWVASSDVSGGGSVTTVTASGPLLSSGGSAPNITLAKATAGVDGYLSSADFTIFAAKLSDFSSLLSSDITGKLGYTPVNPATAVTSVAGRTGVVTLSSSDITGLGSLAGKSTIVSDDIGASAITFDKLNQSSAATGQVIKWNGSAWGASTDNSLSASGGSGYLQFSNGSNSLSSDSSLFWNNAAQQLKIGFNFPSTAQLAVQQHDSDALIDIRSDNGEAKLKVYGGEGLSNGIDFYTYGNGTPHAFIDGRSGSSLGSAGLLIGTKTDRSLNFQTNNSTRLVISSTGQVGVGVTNPTSYALQVSGDVSISGKFKMNGIDISTGSGTVTSVTSGGSPIVVAGTSADPTIAITRATASVDGYLSSSDFTTFAAKLSNFSTLLSSDITGKLGYTPAANNDSRFTDERTPVNGSVTAAKLESGSNGQLFIGNGTGFTKATLTGTTDQVSVTNGSGAITLSTPQSIATSSSPSFTGLTVSGITGNTLLRANGSGVLANATSADVTGLLGYTPAVGSNYVAKTGDTMTGALVNNTNSASTALAVTQAGIGYAATFMGGNVGVGTTSPGTTLDVEQSDTKNTPALKLSGGQVWGPAISFLNLTTGTQFTLLNSGNGMAFNNTGNANTSSFFLSNAGNIGVGTTSPVVKLEVLGLGTGAVVATSGSSDATMNFRAARGTVGVDIGMLDNGTGYLQNRNVANFATNYNFSIQPNGGSVGIGTASPLAPFHVGGLSATTGTISSTGTTVNGTGTNFTTALAVGDQIIASNGVARTITAITNATTLTVSSAFAPDLAAGTGYSRVGVILNTGSVGVGNTAPRATLDVTGTIVSRASQSFAAGTIDFSASNLRHTTQNCGAFALHNLKDGGTYMFAVQGTAVATCSFTAFSDNGVTALTVHLPPDHAATTTGKHTIYNIAVLGTHAYIAWTPGY